jgi:tetratricopeptide (TPR) repeat protein
VSDLSDLLPQIELFISLRRYDDAERLIDQLLAINPRSAAAHLFRASVRFDRSDWAGARAAAREAARLDPTWPDAHSLYALAILADNSYVPVRGWNDRLTFRSDAAIAVAEALAHADRALEFDPSSAYAHGVRAHALLAAGRPAPALAAAETGLSIDPNDITCCAWRHDALVRLGRHQEAARFTRDGLHAKPEEAASHVRLGVLALDSSNNDAALEHARAALLANPNSSDAQSVYWTALAHSGPTASELGRVATSSARSVVLITRSLRKWPVIGPVAYVLCSIALLVLGVRSLNHGHPLLGLISLAILVAPLALLVVPLVIEASLHVGLFARNRRFRIALLGERWWLAAAATTWLVLYFVAFFTFVNRVRMSPLPPALLAICPIAVLLLARHETRVLRWSSRVAFVATVVFALCALHASRHAVTGDAPRAWLVLSILITLFVENIGRRFERRQQKQPVTRP